MPFKKITRASSSPKSSSSSPKSSSSSPKRASSPPKSSSSPPKSSSSSPKSSSSPPKRASSPPKRASSPPKRASSPPKRASSSPKDINRYINSKFLNVKREKKAIIMVGGPGSGKTSGINIVLNMTKQDLRDYVNINPDDILENFFNSDITKYDEAYIINQQLYDRALRDNYNIIFDRTGTNFEDYYNNVISKIKGKEYNIVLCIVYNNYINAKGRIEARRAKTGRAVTENYAKKSYRDLTFNIPKYIFLDCKNIDEIFCFDNTLTSIELIYRSKCINNNRIISINNLI